MGKVLQLRAGGRWGQESGRALGLGVESRSQREKEEQWCGSRHYSGLRHRHRWLPEEVAGLMWLSASGKRKQGKKQSGEKAPFIYLENTVNII